MSLAYIFVNFVEAATAKAGFGSAVMILILSSIVWVFASSFLHIFTIQITYEQSLNINAYPWLRDLHSPWQSSTATQVCCQKLSQKVCDGMPLSVVTSHIQGRQVRSVVKGGWTWKRCRWVKESETWLRTVANCYDAYVGVACPWFSGQKSCSSPNIPLSFPFNIC